jgi:hypothetical protein
MVWLFERDFESFRVETFYDNVRSEYVIVTHEPTGVQKSERFKDTVAFQMRLTALEEQLQSEQWKQSAPPVLLREGWRIT